MSGKCLVSRNHMQLALSHSSTLGMPVSKGVVTVSTNFWPKTLDIGNSNDG